MEPMLLARCFLLLTTGCWVGWIDVVDREDESASLSKDISVLALVKDVLDIYGAGKVLALVLPVLPLILLYK